MEAYIHIHWLDERGENEWQSENDCEMKTLARPRGQRTDKSWYKQD